jgi:hypothetical protein
LPTMPVPSHFPRKQPSTYAPNTNIDLHQILRVNNSRCYFWKILCNQ